MRFIPPNKVPHTKAQYLPSIRRAKSRNFLLYHHTLLEYRCFQLLFSTICSAGIILTETESHAQSRSRGHWGHGQTVDTSRSSAILKCQGTYAKALPHSLYFVITIVKCYSIHCLFVLCNLYILNITRYRSQVIYRCTGFSETEQNSINLRFRIVVVVKIQQQVNLRY